MYTHLKVRQVVKRLSSSFSSIRIYSYIDKSQIFQISSGLGRYCFSLQFNFTLVKVMLEEILILEKLGVLLNWSSPPLKSTHDI